MSLQPQQVQPDNVSNQSQSHHSNGSFGTVFIVLAIILVISVVACVLGRLCNRRYNHNHNHNHNHSHDHHNHNHNQRPVKPPPPPHRPQNFHNNIHPREDAEGDIELGAENKRMPTVISRPNNGHVLHGGAGTGPLHIPPPPNHAMRGFEMKHVGHEGEINRADA